MEFPKRQAIAVVQFSNVVVQLSEFVNIDWFPAITTLWRLSDTLQINSSQENESLSLGIRLLETVVHWRSN